MHTKTSKECLLGLVEWRRIVAEVTGLPIESMTVLCRMRFDVLVAVNVKIADFWNVTPL
jgi:hypothetical protein